MRIGICVNPDDKRGYGRFEDLLYEKIKGHGFSCIDYNMSDTDSYIYTSSDEESEKFLLKQKKLAIDADVEISQVHGPWRWPPQDYAEEDRNERMEKMKKSIKATAMLGCKKWVIHPIMPYGICDIESGRERETWQLNVEFMTELLKTAKEYDVTICIENMPFHQFSLSTPESILKLVKTINDSDFKMCLDTGHVAVFENYSLGNTVRLVGSEVKALHIHDNRCGIDLHIMPYFGVIDWEDFAQALKEVGFNGVFSLETVPSSKLPTPIFEEMSIIFAKIASEIVKDI